MSEPGAEPKFLLRVTRTSSRDIKVRELYIRVDDGKERTLRFGGNFEMELGAGSHSLLVTNRLFKKRIDFEIDEGATFEVANVISGCMAALFIFAVYSVDVRRVETRGD